MNTRTAVRTVLVAAALALIAVALAAAIAATTGATVPLLAVLGVVAAAWYGGIPCGLLAMILSALLMPLALPPLGSFRIIAFSDVVRLILLVIVGMGATLMVAYMRRTAETLGATLASIGDGVLVTDASGRVKTLNREAERLTGWTVGEARGQSVEEVFRIVNEQTRQPVDRRGTAEPLDEPDRCPSRFRNDRIGISDLLRAPRSEMASRT